MNTAASAMMRNLIANATLSIATCRTAHEALYLVCRDNVQWIDVHQDLPPHVRRDFEEWCTGLLPPEPDRFDAGDLMQRLRLLPAAHAKRKLIELMNIALFLHNGNGRHSR